MTAVRGPTVGRRRLRAALRKAREATGLTQEQVASAMDWSLSKLIRIEAGAVSVSTNDVKALLDLYRMTDEQQIRELIALARMSRRRAWWAPYKDAIPASYASFIGLEADASVIQLFQSAGIPGLLQTERYARALVAAAAPAPAVDLEATLELRKRRQQEVLGRAHPPKIEAVLDEATLHRQIGGARCLREQLLHLIKMGSASNITIQVLPFTTTDYAVEAPFIILTFPDPDDAEVVYVEGAMIQDVIDDPEATKRYQIAFRRLRERSLSPADSLDRIAKLAADLG